MKGQGSRGVYSSLMRARDFSRLTAHTSANLRHDLAPSVLSIRFYGFYTKSNDAQPLTGRDRESRARAVVLRCC